VIEHPWFGTLGKPTMPQHRVWGGSCHLYDVPPAPSLRMVLLDAHMRLRASEQAAGTIYGDRRADRIGNRTMKLKAS
jgi:hypothetical protein